MANFLLKGLRQIKRMRGLTAIIMRLVIGVSAFVYIGVFLSASHLNE
jgi:hypothetical protein